MLPDNLLTVVQVFLMEEEEFEEFSQSPFMLGSEFEVDDEEFLVDVYRVLLEIIQAKLKEYFMTFKEGAAFLEQTVKKHTKLAVGLAQSEKRILLDLQHQLVQEVMQLEGNSPPKKRKKSSKQGSKKR